MEKNQKIRKPKKNEDNPKNEDVPKYERESKNRFNPRIEKSSKWRLTLTAPAHATFLLDYHWQNELRTEKMFIIETGNRNSHVHKHDLRHCAKIMDDIWNAKTTKVKVYKMINTLEGGAVLMGDYHF